MGKLNSIQLKYISTFIKIFVKILLKFDFVKLFKIFLRLHFSFIFIFDWLIVHFDHVYLDW